ncbi:MAG: hypothetical protein Q4D71_07385 [Oscillospiraceae bacterium]|nr:hypothetical protein [Oscillospiraceae bacterium]
MGYTTFAPEEKPMVFFLTGSCDASPGIERNNCLREGGNHKSGEGDYDCRADRKAQCWVCNKQEDWKKLWDTLSSYILP